LAKEEQTMMLNPQMLPKIRSEAIMQSAQGQPCSLRVAGFVGMQCSGNATVVGCHLPVVGRGVGTKATDLAVAYGCSVCHEIIDGRDQNARAIILERYPAAFFERLLNALVETQARMVGAGIIKVKGAEIV
jgi:hypothetical protein